MEHKPIEKFKQNLEEMMVDSEPKFKVLQCPSCNSSIQSTNINIQDKLAKCDACHAVFPFEDQVQLSQVTKVNQEVQKPEGIDIFEFKDEMEIAVKPPMLIHEGVALIFAPFIALLFTALYFKKGTFVIIPAVASAVFIWGLINEYFRRNHKIHITIDRTHLSIIWNPKKLVKDRSYLRSEIDQVYILPGGDGYHINMIVNTPDGQKHVKIVGGINSVSKAKYLEQEIEKKLRITDRSVPEELNYSN